MSTEMFTTDATIVGTLRDLARKNAYGVVPRARAVDALMASGWPLARANLDALAKRGEIRIVDVAGAFALTDALGQAHVPAGEASTSYYAV